jgi:hypothetical protein
MVISRVSIIHYALPYIRSSITVTFGALPPPSFSTLSYLVPGVILDVITINYS